MRAERSYEDRKVGARHTALEDDVPCFIPPGKDYAAEQNLRRELGALPEDQRQVVILHMWGELTFLQIGDLLGVSSSTVASRYRYALGKLRDSMSVRENYCADSGG